MLLLLQFGLACHSESGSTAPDTHTEAAGIPCTPTPDEYRHIVCTARDTGDTDSVYWDLCRTYQDSWVAQCEAEGQLCAYTCAQRHGSADGQCAIESGTETAAQLMTACEASCSGALAVGGDATWDGNTRHEEGVAAPLTNRADVLLFAECTWGSACDHLSPGGYCYADY